MPIYESIIDIDTAGPADTTNMTPETTVTRPSWLSFRTKAGLCMLGAATLVMFFAGTFSNNQTPSVVSLSSLPLMGSSNEDIAIAPLSPCTFDECNASNCDHTLAPYTCLRHNGGPHGGCSAVPWADWTCTDQCDLTGCEGLSIPEDSESCDVDCDQEWCDSGRLCGPEVPYQCTAGSSRFGCSADEYQWTFRSSAPSCSSCCNSITCE
jgi:hypothetical protein